MDELIGDVGFSRVRRFDDESRKHRIFAPHSFHSVDVEKLEEQLHEKDCMRQAKIREKGDYEKIQESLLKGWNKAAEDERDLTSYSELNMNRHERVLARCKLEETWRKQEEEAKERLRKELEDRFKPHDPKRVGLLPLDRYKLQDEEPLRDAQIIRSMSDIRRQQIQEHALQQQQELATMKEYENKKEVMVDQWNKKHTEIFHREKNIKVQLANEYLDEAMKKSNREKKDYDAQHTYRIPPEYFSRFGTTSR